MSGEKLKECLRYKKCGWPTNSNNGVGIIGSVTQKCGYKRKSGDIKLDKIIVL